MTKQQKKVTLCEISLILTLMYSFLMRIPY